MSLQGPPYKASLLPSPHPASRYQHHMPSIAFHLKEPNRSHSECSYESSASAASSTAGKQLPPLEISSASGMPVAIPKHEFTQLGPGSKHKRFFIPSPWSASHRSLAANPFTLRRPHATSPQDASCLATPIVFLTPTKTSGHARPWLKKDKAVDDLVALRKGTGT